MPDLEAQPEGGLGDTMGIPFAWLKAPIAWKRGPLIAPDANTMSHVTWRNGALVDSVANTWTMIGAVPQVMPAGKVPPGAGPYELTKYYSAPVAVGATFTACVVYYAATAVGIDQIFCGTDGGTTIRWRVNRGGSTNWGVTHPGVADIYATGGVIGALNVTCIGSTATATYARTNAGPIATRASSLPAGSTVTIGAAPGYAAGPGIIVYEAWITSTPWTSVDTAALIASVKVKTGAQW